MRPMKMDDFMKTVIGKKIVYLSYIGRQVKIGLGEDEMGATAGFIIITAAGSEISVEYATDLKNVRQFEVAIM